MPGERWIILHGGYSLLFIGRVSILAILVSNRVSCFALLNLELDILFLFEEADFFSLLIRPSRNVFHNAFNLGLN